MAFSEEEKKARMAERAKNMDLSTPDLADEILNELESQLKDTHHSTIENLHVAIVQLIVDNTDYTK